MASAAIIRIMSTRTLAPGDLERAFGRALRLRAELATKERAIGRKVQTLARGLGALMEPGEHLHRHGVGLHAFDVEGVVCLAAAYLEEASDEHRYRYAVLCGGEAAKRALRDAPLDPGDSDETGAARRVAIATYADYDDFLYRLPLYVADVDRGIVARLRQAEKAEGRVGEGRRRFAASRRSRAAPARRLSQDDSRA
jgi:hypothetical protein